jgi:hypothetical protein
VEGLLGARLATRPIPLHGAMTPDQQKGKTFERKVGRALGRALDLCAVPKGLASWHVESAGRELRAGQWIRFYDAHGPGWAQPDFFIVAPSCVLVYECKLTEYEATDQELLGLYAPLLAHIYQRPIVRVGVFKHLRNPPIRPIADPLAPLALPRELFHTWHYGAPGP